VKEVVVSWSVDAPREAIERVLTPAAIVEHAGTYLVDRVERLDDVVVVTASAGDLETVLEFTETDTGWIYRQRPDRGPFDRMYASVAVLGDRPVDLVLRSCFTFGLPLSRLTDWFVATDRRTELERLGEGLVAAAGESADVVTERTPSD